MVSVYCYDPIVNDPQSKVRGVGRYLQILRENFPEWNYINDLSTIKPRQTWLTQWDNETIFVNPFFNFLQKPLTLLRTAKKQIAVIHDLIPLKYPDHFPVGIKGKLNIFLNKLALRNYDLVVTDSEASKRDIIEILGFSKNKIRVIYPCLPKIFNQVAKNPISPLLTANYCLYVGDATWNKNLVNLAKAIKIINVTCIFIGNVFNPLTRKRVNELTSYNKWQEEFRLFLKESNKDKRFLLLGYVSDEDLIQLYKNARCNILVSRDEGFGFSYLEASSQACPSILSDIPIFHEISDNKGTVFVDFNNQNDIANSIGEIYFNKEVRNCKGVEAKNRSIYFNQNKFKKDFLEIVQ